MHMQRSEQHNSGYLRVAVLAAGGLLFVLLLFADKSNLTNETRPVLGSASAATSSGASTLPPLAADATTDALIARAEKETGDARATALDSLVSLLEQRKRFDHAARYAQALAGLQNTPAARLRAGSLALEATRLEHISGDSLLFREFSDLAIGQLKTVVEAEPRNEAAQVALGTAYVESRSAQYPPMMGITTLKQVLEQNPRNAGASYILGTFSLRTAQYDKAADRFRAVLAVEPNRPDAMYGLAVALVNTGKQQEAAPLLENVLKLTQDPSLKEQAAKLKGQL